MREMEYTSISTSIHTPQISCLIFQIFYKRDGVYIHISVNTHTSDILSHISDIVWERWIIHPHQRQYTHFRYPVLYFRDGVYIHINVNTHTSNILSNISEMEYTSISVSVHTPQISCLTCIFQTLYGRNGQYTHLRYPVLYFRHCMREMEFTSTSTSTHTPQISCLIFQIVWDRWSLHSYQRQYTHLRYPVIFQTLYERDGVYIHINVNTHTSDILSFISDIV